MKNLIPILILLSFCVSFSQTEKDTIVMSEKEIIFKTDTLYSTKKYVLWKVTFKNNIVGRFQLNRTKFNDCYE